MTVYPPDVATPDVSNINWSRPSEVRAGSAIAELDDAGQLKLLMSGTAKLIIDVTGAWVPSSLGAAAGRLETIAPVRALDTRTSDQKVGSDSTITVGLPPEVPADASAIIATVTATDPDGWGFLSAFAAGAPRPEASVVNFDGAHEDRSVGVIIPTNASGISIYTSRSTHVLVDITGYITGPGAPAADNGLMYTGTTPRRILDTRKGAMGRTRVGGWIDTLSLDDTYRPVVAAITLTMTDGSSSGWAAMGPSGNIPANSSVTNWASGETVAALDFVPVQIWGSATIVTGGGDGSWVHVVADVHALFIGKPDPITGVAWVNGKANRSQIWEMAGLATNVSPTETERIARTRMPWTSTHEIDSSVCRRTIGWGIREIGPRLAKLGWGGGEAIDVGVVVDGQIVGWAQTGDPHRILIGCNQLSNTTSPTVVAHEFGHFTIWALTVNPDERKSEPLADCVAKAYVAHFHLGAFHAPYGCPADLEARGAELVDQMLAIAP